MPSLTPRYVIRQCNIWTSELICVRQMLGSSLSPIFAKCPRIRTLIFNLPRTHTNCQREWQVRELKRLLQCGDLRRSMWYVCFVDGYL